MTWWKVGVDQFMLSVADDMEEGFAVHLVCICFWIMLPYLSNVLARGAVAWPQQAHTHFGNFVRINFGFSAMVLQSVK